MNPSVKNLISQHKKRKSEIRNRLAEFRATRKNGNESVFAELCFCILTANANALLCDKAIKELKGTGLLCRGSVRQIKPRIKGRVRFHNKKAQYIVGARNLLKEGNSIDIKNRIDARDILTTREWLVDNIKGLGYKEASHFLRNIGLGRDIAILDRHILKNLKKHGVIDRIPDSLGSRKTYLDIEGKMRAFSGRIGIPLDELDLLFWSLQTGFVFK